ELVAIRRADRAHPEQLRVDKLIPPGPRQRLFTDLGVERVTQQRSLREAPLDHVAELHREIPPPLAVLAEERQTDLKKTKRALEGVRLPIEREEGLEQHLMTGVEQKGVLIERAEAI